ncbi:uncharacterized protein LOC106061930 isoform X2 [Biomphalaria glabrata]|uniref:Uncharacterized protein LOC106061930 isoform X2 n=1 Tax=Biomphalaria glabrata TaxID=6526 RepID=A0A9W3B8X3_BIOGL|nr:uncharacterized protein LOC106061930 isoform X2 [Biomphalaria glabrata]
MSQCNISCNALLIESISFGSYDELAKRYERFDGDLHVKGNGNQLNGFILNTERDANGKTYMWHTGLVKVEGHNYHISGMRKNNSGFGLLNTTYFIHHGVIKVLGNGNEIDRLFLEAREDAGALHNVGIQILGNGNVVRDPAFHDNRKTNATTTIEVSDIIQITGMGNISCGLYTYVDPNSLPTAKTVKVNVRNIRNPQPTSSNPCGAPCQNNEGPYQVQLSAEHEHNFIGQKTQTQGVQAKTRDGQTTQTQGVQAKTRDGQVGISRATLSSQTDNASSGHLYEGPGKTSQTETELNSQPAQELVRELEILKTQRLCKVCFSQNAGVTFAPCGHLASCVDCFSTVDRCPVCLSSIDGIVKTFFP